MAWNEHTGEKLRQAVVDADGARKAKSFSADRQPVDFTTFVDALKPRPFYSNGAREFLKTIDWSCRYVAVSSSALLTWSNLLETLADVDLASQGWRAVLLGRPPEQGWQSLPERVTAASHAGLDLAMQLALAVEADAFVGPIDKFAIVAALAGKPAAIVSSNDAIAEQLKVLPNVLLESSSTTPLVAVTSLLLSVKDRAQI